MAKYADALVEIFAVDTTQLQKMLAVSDYISGLALKELTFHQLEVLYWAARHEMNRDRHHKEPWMSQADRDKERRDEKIHEAKLLGVTDSQIDLAVYGRKS